jgi:hypothetical protein
MYLVPLAATTLVMPQVQLPSKEDLLTRLAALLAGLGGHQLSNDPQRGQLSTTVTCSWLRPCNEPQAMGVDSTGSVTLE